MSHIAITRVKIKNPVPEFLAKAVRILATELKGELIQEIIDYSGNKIKVPLGLKTSKMIRGVGILVNDSGEVEFKGDFWNYKGEIENLKNSLIQTYTYVAVNASLSKLGYKSIKQHKRNDIVYIYAEV